MYRYTWVQKGMVFEVSFEYPSGRRTYYYIDKNNWWRTDSCGRRYTDITQMKFILRLDDDVVASIKEKVLPILEMLDEADS